MPLPHELLTEYSIAVYSVDQKHLLWSKAVDESIGIDTVIERVYKLKYKDFASLKVLILPPRYSLTNDTHQSNMLG